MYFFSTPVTGQQPYIAFNSGSALPPQSYAITVALPNLFASPPSNLPQTTTLSLTAGSGALAYNLSVATNGPAWTFDNTSIRASVSSDVVSFLKQVEAAGALNGAIPLLQQVIAQYLPLTFGESLYYRYGYNPTLGYIDLQPGMRLRLDFETYQQPNTKGSALINGFVGVGSSYIQVVEKIGSNGSLVTSFSPLMSMLTSMSVTPNLGGGGGAVDLFGIYSQPAIPSAYFRLFYPKTLSSADSSGSAVISNNIAIVGASSFSAMDAATTQYFKNYTFPSNVTATFFRGRVMITPEIPVSLNGSGPTWVEVGTTLRQVLRGYTYVPRLGAGMSLPSAPNSPLQRWLQGFPSAGWSYLSTQNSQGKFNFGLSSSGSSNGYTLYASNVDSFDVPLHGGDNITF